LRWPASSITRSLHAEREEYGKNKHTLSRNELRLLVLDLRKQNEGFQALRSQVAQQVAERFHRPRQRFFDRLTNKQKEKKPHKFLSLVYPQFGWRLSNIIQTGNGKSPKRKTRLYLSRIGFFTLILHGDFPLSRVFQVCVKLYPSGRIHVVFLVEEPETRGSLRRSPRGRWVLTWEPRGLPHSPKGRAGSSTPHLLR